MFQGIVYMLIGIALLSFMDATVKLLVTDGISPIQVIALRTVIILPLIYVVFRLRGEHQHIKPVRWGWHVLRGSVGFLAPFCFFLGLRYLPLSDVVVMFFSATLIITMMSALFLKEQVGKHRWLAVVIGFVGVIIAMQPQGDGMLLGYVLALIASFAYAFIFITGSMLSKTETVVSLVFSFHAVVGAYGLVLLPLFWSAITATQIGLIATVAVLAASGHFCITTAFAKAEASVIAPFEYSALIWAVLFDLLFWQHIPVFTTWVGALIIIGSNLYILYRERVHQKQTAKTCSLDLN